MMKNLAVIFALMMGCSVDGPPEPPTEPPVQTPPTAGKADSAEEAVPYFYQYDNELHPGSTCQNTSVAMVLAHLGWDGTPDDITREWGTTYAQSPDGLNYMFNTITNEYWLPGALWTTTTGEIEEFRSAASGGNVIIVHGYFTGYGHVVVVTGFDGTHYTVNDPAGEWGGEFGGGYTGQPEDGRAVEYSAAQFEAAIATSDGQSFLPIWYHVLRRF
jgi:hypothetical protein